MLNGHNEVYGSEASERATVVCIGKGFEQLHVEIRRTDDERHRRNASQRDRKAKAANFNVLWIRVGDVTREMTFYDELDLQRNAPLKVFILLKRTVPTQIPPPSPPTHTLDSAVSSLSLSSLFCPSTRFLHESFTEKVYSFFPLLPHRERERETERETETDREILSRDSTYDSLSNSR